jgi:hypothetical protein
MRKGFDGLAVSSSNISGRTRSAASSSPSADAGANNRHSAYSLRSATIAYRWHPLAGRTLQVAPFRRGKNLTCIYTDERPDLSRELPNWMFGRGVHRSGDDLEAAINAFLAHHNADPKPFRWIKSAEDILAAVERFCTYNTSPT